MFDRAIIDTDKFMDMSMGTKALYFLLGMEADDEGFVSHKKVMRIHGGNEDDLRVLVAKGFVIVFPSGVSVITDWNKNNWLDSRRIRPTEYQKEKSQLVLTDKQEYVLSTCLASIEERSTEQLGEVGTSQAIEIVKDSPKDERVATPRKYPNSKVVFDWFPKPERSWSINTTELKHAELLFLRGEKQVKLALEFLLENEDHEFIPRVTKPSDLERKWVDILNFKKKYNL